MSKNADYKMTMADWDVLSRMREGYLGERARTDWSDPKSLELYDRFFGQRIADKWRGALTMCRDREAMTPWTQWLAGLQKPLQIWDWGCGTGRASRTLLEDWGLAGEQKLSVQVALSDRLGHVEDWAWRQLSENSPRELTRIKSQEVDLSRTVLLVSHVLNELSSQEATALADVAVNAAWVFWVENGTQATSRRLAMIRNKIRHTHQMVAPCLGQGTCQAVEGKDHTHWCHFFSTTPSEYFQDGEWADFAKHVGVDLRSLPFSFFASRRGLEESVKPEKPDEGANIGRSRVYKGYAQALVCDVNTQLQEWQYPKKQYGDLYKALKKERAPLYLPRPLLPANKRGI